MIKIPQYKPKRHNPDGLSFAKGAGVLSLIVFFALMLVPNPLVSEASLEDTRQVSRGEFISMVSNNQPDHPFLPKNHAELSQEKLYEYLAKTLKIRGFKVLDGKDPKESMTNQEFVRVAYALSGAPPGKNLFEQKQFLKQQGVIQSADIGIATGTEGKILQFHENQTASSHVKLASPIFMNDRIKTNKDSKATFTFDDKSSLTIGESASISIKKHIYDPDKDLRQTIVHIALGTVRFVVTKGKAKGSSFKVVTPTATAGVRGTEFVVTVAPNGRTSFFGIEGEIETAPLLPNRKEGKGTLVAKGQTQEVLKNGNATKVKKIPPGQLKRLKKKTKPINKGGQKGFTQFDADKIKGPFLKNASNKIRKGGGGSTNLGKDPKPGPIVKKAATKAAKKLARQSARKSSRSAVRNAVKQGLKEAKVNGKGNGNSGKPKGKYCDPWPACKS